MAVSGRPILGVDINPDEVRVVELRGSWSAFQVTDIAYAPTPPGAMEGDRVLDPDAVADTLRRLLNSRGITTRDTVMGLAARSVVTRVIDIPRVPDKEMRVVIEGEMHHYQILREGSGTFDYIRLHGPDEAADANLQVLLMAAEDLIVSGYREVAERAGLNLLALEPVLAAMYRAAFAQAQAQPTLACLAITHGKSEIAIADGGNLRLYRRVDTGSDDLIMGRDARSDSSAEERVLLGGDEEEPTEPETSDTGPIRLSAANNLALEIQRSVDYYRREYPNAGEIGRLYVATNDPDLEPLVAWLYEALGMEIELVGPPGDATSALAGDLAMPSGVRYLGAAGLALHELAGHPAGLPHFDLSTIQRAIVVAEADRRRMSLALAGSVALVLLGLGAAYSVGLRANGYFHELGHLQDDLVAERRLHESQIAFMQQQHDQLAALEKQGFAVPRIVDAVASAMDSRASVTDVTLDQTGRIVISGDAAGEPAIIQTLEHLKTCAYFTNPTLDSFDSNSSNYGQAQTVRFEVSSPLAGALPPPAPTQNP